MEGPWKPLADQDQPARCSDRKTEETGPESPSTTQPAGGRQERECMGLGAQVQVVQILSLLRRRNGGLEWRRA